MNKFICASGVLLSVAFIVGGCQKASDGPQAKQYDLHGKVVAVDKDRKTVTLDHEDIPGLMQGMEMEFKVEDPKLLEDIGAGDEVHGQLEVRSGDYIIKDLTKH
jgi:Cu/Ag efflux protein CusF